MPVLTFCNVVLVYVHTKLHAFFHFSKSTQSDHVHHNSSFKKIISYLGPNMKRK